MHFSKTKELRTNTLHVYKFLSSWLWRVQMVDAEKNACVQQPDNNKSGQLDDPGGKQHPVWK